MRADHRLRRAARGAIERLGISDEVSAAYSLASARHRRERRDQAGMRRLLAFALRDGGLCLDIGAHDGSVAAEMHRCAPEARIVAFEPIAELAARCRARVPTAEVCEVAISNVTGEADFLYVPEFPAYSGLRRRDYPGSAAPELRRVRTDRIDGVLDPEEELVFVKIDVEGAEHRVLEGGMHAIHRWRPIIAIEIGSAQAAYGTNPLDTFELLTVELGLLLFDLDGAGPFTRGEFGAIQARGARWNFVARP